MITCTSALFLSLSVALVFLIAILHSERRHSVSMQDKLVQLQKVVDESNQTKDELSGRLRSTEEMFKSLCAAIQSVSSLSDVERNSFMINQHKAEETIARLSEENSEMKKRLHEFWKDKSWSKGYSKGFEDGRAAAESSVREETFKYSLHRGVDS